MRRGIFIIIFGLLLIVVAVVLYAAYQQGLIGGESGIIQPPIGLEGTGADGPPTPTPKTTASILVATGVLNRGDILAEDDLKIIEWPLSSLPDDAILGSEDADLDEDGIPDAIDNVEGYIVRKNAEKNEPVLTSMIVSEADLYGTGSDAALAVPDGRVLIAIPIPDIADDPTSAVAYAIRAGDHIDLMMSVALVDLDEEFQTALINHGQVFLKDEAAEGPETLQMLDFRLGRFEDGPLGLTFNVLPSEPAQRPRLTTQLTVQDAVVVHVGRYPSVPEDRWGIDPFAPPTPTPMPEATPEGGAPQPASAEPAPKPPVPRSIVLAVTPQEALVIKFAWEISADVDLVLRGFEDTTIFNTEPVTLEYLFESYDIEMPEPLEYGVQPPTIHFSGSGE